MDRNLKRLFNKRKAIIATMHHKEQVIGPLLEEELGLQFIVPENFSSDVFGTFTGEVERVGNQLEAARKKLETAMEQYNLDIGISSEGSFRPHPILSVVPYNRELILFIDKKNELEITGYVANSNTNYAHQEVKSFEAALEFAKTVGFPEHGLIVKKNKETINQYEIIKGISTEEALEKAITKWLPIHSIDRKEQKPLFMETDMRAMFNPSRMKNIKLATEDLLTKIKSLCPNCDTPGFSIKEVKKGLPCQLCGFPTETVRSHIYECNKCGYEKENLYPNREEYADPTYCRICNP
ncbi:hypothetical protein QA612_00610 [Evansella sp. AB-P1]|uniref:DUF6671 family protein n=1 Tax=Evansella sp. AB-P1 TaxID=3037653 RepID=UPI00241DBE13|nr:DUF6671 family protein [Evansella sp. AB-P1]MDG5785972.1 hypothetical protein [Evansella sp. AB-P1]